MLRMEAPFYWAIAGLAQASEAVLSQICINSEREEDYVRGEMGFAKFHFIEAQRLRGTSRMIAIASSR